MKAGAILFIIGACIAYIFKLFYHFQHYRKQDDINLLIQPDKIFYIIIPFVFNSYSSYEANKAGYWIKIFWILFIISIVTLYIYLTLIK